MCPFGVLEPAVAGYTFSARGYGGRPCGLQPCSIAANLKTAQAARLDAGGLRGGLGALQRTIQRAEDGETVSAETLKSLD